jgi:hypothetical protein
MTYQINYSFYLGFEPDILYFVNVPLTKLEGQELNVDTVRTVVEEDSDLILELLGPGMLGIYEQFCMAPHLYQKELQRFDESVRLVEVKDEKPSLDATRVEATLRDFISVHVDYDIHKNFESDEETGEDAYGELAKEFIKLYNKQ